MGTGENESNDPIFWKKCLWLRPKAELDIFSETSRDPVNYRTGERDINGCYYSECDE